MNNDEDTVLDFGEEEFDRNRTFKHPVAVGFHLAFRIGALLAYLFCGWFSDSFITNFVVIVILLSMDFWTVKNISGRLLVGLRWWNYVDEEGNSKWMFESRKMVSVIGVIMNGSNLLGYIRCKWGTKQNMTSLAKSFLTRQALKSSANT
ncbi:TV23B-like protein [Mya arenaria]|uniref:Golgi apparatus membrane protein TVP23 homolog n=1 Tax=Mya arenaria TaxID=6604 RepID=A0ABY7DHG3_MYAAR|nr:TV23B-like protein [Mya arenaria]